MPFKGFKKFKIKKTITFHSRIENAKIFSELNPVIKTWMNDNILNKSQIFNDYISSKMNTFNRNIKLNMLRFK